nr:MAG TPA: hypothetical protein [Caudoviricetes sp.]
MYNRSAQKNKKSGAHSMVSGHRFSVSHQPFVKNSSKKRNETT